MRMQQIVLAALLLASACGEQALLEVRVAFLQSEFPDLDGRGFVELLITGEPAEPLRLPLLAECFAAADEVEYHVLTGFDECVEAVHVVASLKPVASCTSGAAEDAPVVGTG